jgi:hypothetical protein
MLARHLSSAAGRRGHVHCGHGRLSIPIIPPGFTNGSRSILRILLDSQSRPLDLHQEELAEPPQARMIEHRVGGEREPRDLCQLRAQQHGPSRNRCRCPGPMTAADALICMIRDAVHQQASNRLYGPDAAICTSRWASTARLDGGASPRARANSEILGYAARSVWRKHGFHGRLLAPDPTIGRARVGRATGRES